MPSRRSISALCLIALLVLTACTTTSATSADSVRRTAPSRPNIVFVLTDDLSMNLIGHMSQVRKMRREGTTLSKYYVVDSLCCPSRSAIFTGQYPHDDGVFTNAGTDGGYAGYNAHGNEQRSFALTLQQRGYRTGFMGKYLNGYAPTDPIPPGWDDWDVAGNAYYEYNYTLNENGAQQYYPRDGKNYLVDVLATKATSFIDSAATTGQPFMLEVAPFAPHAPYTVARRYRASYPGLTYPKTPAFNAQATNPPTWLGHRPRLNAAQRAQLNTYYRMRVQADLAVNNLIGRLRRELQATGLADNTYVVFSSDNGYHMGEYRLGAGKQTAFDTDTHVPLVVTGPGVPAGRVNSQLTSSIDLAPTFAALSGAAPGTWTDGTSMAALWHGQRPSRWQQGVLIEHHGPAMTRGDPDAQTPYQAETPSYEAVRTATALYVRYAGGEKEYYDTVSDPYELHNLGARAVPARLKLMLHALATCHNAAACQVAAAA